MIIKHFGVDSREVERNITRPLEDAISLIPGIEELRSISEFGKSRTNLILAPGVSEDEVYLLLRDAVDRIYNRLPASVQKPQIISSSIDQRPVFVASIRSEALNSDELRKYVEKDIKPSYEKIEGTGEIEVGGGEVKEIHVQVDIQRKLKTIEELKDLELALANGILIVIFFLLLFAGD
ncbi:unnamed protein product, partial [marine sediment metagenome]